MKFETGQNLSMVIEVRRAITPREASRVLEMFYILSDGVHR